MNIKLTKRDIVWSYVGTIVSMGSHLIILPFLMYYLDSDMLGLWYVFASVGALATLFDFGFSVTFARNITYCWSGARSLKKKDVAFVNNSEPDFVMMKQVLTTCKVIYAIIAGTAYLLLLTLGTAYIFYIARNIDENTHIIAWLLYSTGTFLNLYFGYYNSFLRGIGAIERANKNTIISKCIQITSTVVLLVLGLGIIGASVSYLLYGTVFRQLGKYYFYNYKGIRNKLNAVTEKITKKQIKEMLSVVWYNAWRDGIISICNYFCSQASTIICSLYLPLEQTGVYAIGVQIASAISQVAGTLYNAYQPVLQSAYINLDKEKLRKTMSMIIVSFICIFFVGTIVVCIVGLPFLRLIKPTAIVSVPILLGLSFYQFVLKLRNCYASYFSSTNRIIYMNGFIASAILCVIFSFWAIGVLNYGVCGLIVAQVLSQAYNLWRWLTLANKELGLSFRDIIIIGIEEVKLLAGKFLPKIRK